MTINATELNIKLEMKALDAEISAMHEANIERDQQGHTHAYGSEAFFEMAEKFRALRRPTNE